MRRNFYCSIIVIIAMTEVLTGCNISSKNEQDSSTSNAVQTDDLSEPFYEPVELKVFSVSISDLSDEGYFEVKVDFQNGVTENEVYFSRMWSVDVDWNAYVFGEKPDEISLEKLSGMEPDITNEGVLTLTQGNLIYIVPDCDAKNIEEVVKCDYIARYFGP